MSGPGRLRVGLAPGALKEATPTTVQKVEHVLGLKLEELEPPSPGTTEIIVCARVADLQMPVAGATGDHVCRYCGERVWLSPSSQAVLPRAPWIVCRPCGPRLAADIGAAYG